MKALGVIPARKGSERFPNKHHALLLGKPMFAYTLEAALAAEGFDRVVVSSDDWTLKPLADQYGIEFIPRPADLASSTAALDDAIRHVCQVLADRDRYYPDVVLTMQGNVPIRKPGQIDEAIERLQTYPQATAFCTAQEVFLRPEWSHVLKDEVTGEVAPYLDGTFGYRTQDFARLFHMDGAIYAVRTSTLWETAGNKAVHSWFGKHLHLIIQDKPIYSHEIDYPHQLQLAEFYLMCQQYGDDWYKQSVLSLNSQQSSQNSTTPIKN